MGQHLSQPSTGFLSVFSNGSVPSAPFGVQKAPQPINSNIPFSSGFEGAETQEQKEKKMLEEKVKMLEAELRDRDRRLEELRNGTGLLFIISLNPYLIANQFDKGIATDNFANSVFGMHRTKRQKRSRALSPTEDQDSTKVPARL
jgi:hypothetical protein